MAYFPLLELRFWLPLLFFELRFWFSLLLLDGVDEREFEERLSERFMISVGLELRVLNMLFSKAEFAEPRFVISLLAERPGSTVFVFSFVAFFCVSWRFTVDLLTVDLPEFSVMPDRVGVFFSAALLLEISGRYRLTERLLTVDLPGREEFVTWWTFTLYPVSLRYSWGAGPL